MEGTKKLSVVMMTMVVVVAMAIEVSCRELNEAEADEHGVNGFTKGTSPVGVFLISKLFRPEGEVVSAVSVSCGEFCAPWTSACGGGCSFCLPGPVGVCV